MSDLTLGFAAALITTGAWLPQVYKTWTSRDAGDFSWGYLTLFSIGISLWLLYGLRKDDLAVIGANAVTLLLVLVIAYVKARQRV